MQQYQCANKIFLSFYRGNTVFFKTAKIISRSADRSSAIMGPVFGRKKRTQA